MSGPDLGSLRGDGGALHWLDGGRLMRQDAGDVTPEGVRVGGGVHTYGGGDHLVTAAAVWCATPQGLFRGGTLVAEGAFGDLVLGDGELLAVREDGSGDALVAVPLDGGDVRVLAEAAGFFGAPRPTDGMLAWTWWSARDMPWDGCEMWVAAYEPGGQIGDPMRVAGGPDESALEPRWGPDGMLYFMSDRTGWWNLYRHDGTAIAPLEADCAAPPWELGQSSYCFLDDGRIAMIAREGPAHRLVIADGSGAVSPVPVPYTSIKPCLTAWGSSVALIGSSPTLAQQVAIVPSPSPSPSGGLPERLDVSVDGDRQVVALVYPPAGATSEWSAPLIVRAHPGPAASVELFTSHGFAVADVDSTGSAGYGRAFRQALYGRWGVLDVADCRAVAEHLIAAGRAVPGQVFVRGAGTGGYTALQAVSSDGPFAAATAVSPVVDPERWASTAPRFHRPYAVRLGGAPVTAAAIRTPVLLIHGADDPVTSPAGTAALADDLRSRGAPHELLLLAGTGHDVPASDEALEAELRLYQSFEVPGIA
ncbi:prolyl oligopeptidase family serine peptidase [Dactylosporangium sp. NPDC005555]|uniref:prolyl oligopeptidase family serine peptidase n=1 Tax=Dactylosporangium sp. NPDC005555 TaxID=3154889 RepID=UPI0033ABFBC9